MTSSIVLALQNLENNTVIFKLNIKSIYKDDIPVSKSAVYIRAAQMISISTKNSFNFSWIQWGPFLLQLYYIADTVQRFINTL